jgi:predicted dehydrogenase
VNVLIIGLGSIARKHIAALRSLALPVNLLALRSGHDSPHTEGVQDLYSWEEVPAEIAFAIISLPTHRHTEAIAECADRHIPVFIEKPVAASMNGLHELSASLQKEQVLNYVACNLRFLPVLQFLKQELGSKRINEVSVYCGSDLSAWRPGTDFRKSYSADETKGGGVHLDLFHELDYVCWIFGMPVSSRGIVRNQSALGINAPDFANYLLFYPHFTAGVTLNYYRKDAKREIEIVFENGTWTADLLKNTVTNEQGLLVFENTDTSIKDTYLPQMKYFIDCVNGRDKITNDVRASMDILKLALQYEKID